MKHFFGWLRDLPDQRDKLYKIEFRKEIQTLKKLPSFVNLTDKMPPVYAQGELGSCTAQAIAGAIQYLQKDFMPSRLFIYYNERVMINTVKEDSGAIIRDGIKSVVRDGVCHEKYWKYKIKNFKRKPYIWCYINAEKNQITEYYRIKTIKEMKSCLAMGYPFIFGFAVYEGIDNPKVIKTGELNMPKPEERMMGGHAVLAVGYDDKRKRFIVRNSWGIKWGKKGYFTMPYDYVDGELSSDFWMIKQKEL